MTVLLVDRLNERRFRRILKRDLIRQMAVSERDFASQAVDRLRMERWLDKGALNGGVFANARLSGVNLEGAEAPRRELHGCRSERSQTEGRSAVESYSDRCELEECGVEGCGNWRVPC